MATIALPVGAQVKIEATVGDDTYLFGGTLTEISMNQDYDPIQGYDGRNYGGFVSPVRYTLEIVGSLEEEARWRKS